MDARCGACGAVGPNEWSPHICSDMQMRQLRGEQAFPPNVLIHGNVTIGSGTTICGPSDINGKDSHVAIGDGCDIAAFVSINCADSHLRCIGAAAEIQRLPIYIADHVFIGQGATILGGCRIGTHSVVGAGVVMKNVTVPPYSRVRLPYPHIDLGFYGGGNA